MADEKKVGDAEVNKAPVSTDSAPAEKASKVQKAEKSKTEKAQKPQGKFSFKKIGKAIAKFFKDQKGEINKIVWPGRQMVIKSTGVVLASILIIGAGIWIVDYALSGAVTAIGKAASATTETTAVSDTAATTAASDKSTEASTEDTSATTAATEVSTTKAQ